MSTPAALSTCLLIGTHISSFPSFFLGGKGFTRCSRDLTSLSIWHSRQWKCVVLITGSPENSPSFFLKQNLGLFSWSPLSPSSLLHVTVWISLGVPHCGEFSLHCLRCAIIGAVWMERSWGYYKNKLKTRGRRLKSKTWEQQRSPDSREH